MQNSYKRQLKFINQEIIYKEVQKTKYKLKKKLEYVIYTKSINR